MNKDSIGKEKKSNCIQHTLRIMRITVFLFFFSIMLSHAATSHSQETKVSLNLKATTIDEACKAIEKQTGFVFVFADNTEDAMTRKASIQANSASISNLLDDLFLGTGLGYAIIDKQVVVYKEDKKDDPSEIHDIFEEKLQHQKKIITGKITDVNGEAIIGANIIEKGTTNGTVTDIDGNFSLHIEENAVLQISYIGYLTQEIVTSGKNSFDIILNEDTKSLEDLVVVGYGVQNKRDVTTSISSIKAEDFANMPTTDFRDAMAAKMPGVQVLQLGGQPDGNVSIRVRGVQSLTSGNDPLYVIDGIVSDERAFANINGNDIESLEVLKDASAAAIYGSRGSTGVILITTKRGKTERPLISYDGQYNFSNVAKKIDMLNAYEWSQLYKESRDAAYLDNVPTGSIDDPYENRPQTYHRVDPLATAYLLDTTRSLNDTDWQDAIFRTAHATSHSLSISSNKENINYYIGLNYLNREGTIINSDFERYGIRINLDGKYNKMKYGVNFSPSYSKTNYISSDAQYNSDGVVAAALMASPIFPVYKVDGSYNWDMNGLLRKTWDTQVNDLLNPVALAKEIDDVREKMSVLGNIYASYELMKGLEYKFTVGGDYYSYIRNFYRPSTLPLQGMAYFDRPSDPTARYEANSYFHWSTSNQLSFLRSFGDHNVNATAVYETEKTTVQASQIVAKGTAGDDKIRTTKGKTIDVDNTFNNKYGYTFASWLLRAQYSYKGRYMFSGSMRGDGSSRFAPNTRWGYFPAASVGWRMSDEQFMQNFRSIDDFKIRASIGQTGNAQIGNADYLALYSVSSTDLGNGVVSQVYPSQIANNELKWEKNTQRNIGFDLVLWRDALSLNVDYYYTKTTDMLFDVPVPSVSGLTSSNMNIGSMENRGIELTIGSKKRYGDFSYAVAANWTLNRNKVLSLGDENADIIKTASYSGAYYITRVGQPVGSYFLLVQDGIFKSQEELDSYPHFDTTKIGDFRFVDADGDGILDKEKDRVIVGNYMPDFFYGFSVNLNYKDFDLLANFQGVYGNEILNLERRYLLNMEASSNMMREALQRFPYGDLNRATRKSTGNNGASTSTFHIEDGSYLRLQNLSFGYNFPAKITDRIGVHKLRVYIQASNLFTWTSYTGYNPEVNKRASDALRPGEDYSSYPLSRTFSFGLNFNL